jgi:hypothetical protein
VPEAEDEARGEGGLPRGVLAGCERGMRARGKGQSRLFDVEVELTHEMMRAISGCDAREQDHHAALEQLTNSLSGSFCILQSICPSDRALKELARAPPAVSRRALAPARARARMWCSCGCRVRGREGVHSASVPGVHVLHHRARERDERNKREVGEWGRRMLR